MKNSSNRSFKPRKNFSNNQKPHSSLKNQHGVKNKHSNSNPKSLNNFVIGHHKSHPQAPKSAQEQIVKNTSANRGFDNSPSKHLTHSKFQQTKRYDSRGQQTKSRGYFKKDGGHPSKRKTDSTKGSGLKSTHEYVKNSKLQEAKLIVTFKGIGIIPLPDSDERAEVDKNDLGGAFHGDTVLFETYWSKDRWTKERKLFARVKKVTKHGRSVYVGTVLTNEFNKKEILPDDRRLYLPIKTTESDLANIEMNTKVVFEIDWQKSTDNFLFSKVIEVIGKKGEHETEIRAIIIEKQISTSFQPEVEQEAKDVQAKWIETKKEIEVGTYKSAENRLDCRPLLTFTIDPEDAKDFDDALSFEELTNGDQKVGVHIADVSYFVKEKGLIDREAVERGLSTYLVDRTIPMLPSVLSDDICSLNPNEIKFAFSVFVLFDKHGKVKDREFHRTIIKSDRRFTYENAQELLNEAKANPELIKTDKFKNALYKLNKLAEVLRVEKFQNGAIEFEQEEVKFKLDENGKPIKIIKKERLDTHKLIEDFMLLANREVAEVVKRIFENSKEVPLFVYRIHDLPDPEKIRNLAIFAKALGHEFNVENKNKVSKELNKLLRAIDDLPEADLIRRAAVRSMSKASYSTKNIGHFGLAFEDYSHFTSPIRRYPDLIAHRLLWNYLQHGLKAQNASQLMYERLLEDLSQKEVNVAGAERESIKFKQTEFMLQFIGQRRKGIISGIAEWGFYVEDEETKAEGVVRVKSMEDDYYIFDAQKYEFTGEKTGRKFRLGDKIEVLVKNVSVDERFIEFGV